MAKKDSGEWSKFDEVERLRTEYTRELTGLSKMLIALSSGILALLLSPTGVAISTRAGTKATLTVWLLLCLAAIQGFMQVFLFSSRFSSRAEYLWNCQIVDTLVALGGPDDKLNEFLGKTDRYKKSHAMKYRACVLLVLGQGLCLFATFAVLAYPVYRLISAQPR